MSQALYHSTLVEHAQAGRARGRLAAPHRSATVDNPLCGDRVTIDLALADDRIAAASSAAVLPFEALAKALG